MKQLETAARKWGVPLTETELNLFGRYAQMVLEKNSRLNITSAGTAAEIFNRHIADGVYAFSVLRRYFASDTRPVIADAGAGGGYIGVTLKILMPNAHVVMLESVSRKCAFLNWVGAGLCLSDYEVMPLRLEKNSFPLNADCVIERAMGKLPDIAPLCLAQLKPGGLFAAYQSGEETREAIVSAVPSARLEELADYILPAEKTVRRLAVFTTPE